MPTDLSSNLEQQLRGIHMPEAVSWWPLAFGWWLLITVSLIAIGFSLYKLYALKKSNRYRKSAISELKQSLNSWQQNSDTQAYLQNANSVLKRVVRRFDATSVNQSGNEWANTLRRFGKESLPKEVTKALCEDCYQAEPHVDIPQLHTQLQHWLATHQGVNHA